MRTLYSYGSLSEQEQPQINRSSQSRMQENEPNADGSVAHRSCGLKFVEPVIFLTIIFTSMYSLVSTNVVELQYCKFFLHLNNKDVCLNHSAPHSTSMGVFMSTYSMLQMISISIFPAVAAIFIGPWSDTFGRRPLMLSSIFGCVMTATLWTWGHETNLHPYYFLLFDIPLALGGSGTVILLAAYCYICDVTTPSSRAFRMGLFYAIVNTGSLVGTLVTPYLKDISYTLTMSVSALIGLVSFMYVLLFLQESVSTTEAERQAVSKNPFQWSYVKSIYEVCYVRQTSETFTILFHVGLLSLLSTAQTSGEGTVFYLFWQNVLGWDLTEYTHLLIIAIITSVLSSTLATSKMVGLSDLEIISFGIAIRLFSALAFFLSPAKWKWFIYLTNPLGNMGGICGTIARNFISKIMQPEDLGKVFALLGLLDALAPLIGSPPYSLIYQHTLKSHPRMIFLFSAFLCLVMLTLAVRLVQLYFSFRNRQPLLSPGSRPIRY